MTHPTPASVFAALLSTDVSRHVERKGKFFYLSWSYAVAELGRVDPTATWEVIKFPLPDAPHVHAPYCATPAGCFVEVAVTVQGRRLSQVHPVIDERNATIANPKADQINKSIMRCLVKAIALHGLGLNIYAGEDLPLGDADEDPPKKPVKVDLPKKPTTPTALDKAPAYKLARLLSETKDTTELAYGVQHISEVVDDSADGKALRIGLDALADEASARIAGQEWRPTGNAKWPAAAKWLRGEMAKAGV
jgi:hypothetical protein